MNSRNNMLKFDVVVAESPPQHVLQAQIFPSLNLLNMFTKNRFLYLGSLYKIF